MVARAEGGKIKTSARRVLPKSSALYLFETEDETLTARERFAAWCEGSTDKNLISALPIYTRDMLPQLVSRIRAIRHSPLDDIIGAGVKQ
jgi:hypothetical protein